MMIALNIVLMAAAVVAMVALFFVTILKERRLHGADGLRQERTAQARLATEQIAVEHADSFPAAAHKTRLPHSEPRTRPVRPDARIQPHPSHHHQDQAVYRGRRPAEG